MNITELTGINDEVDWETYLTVILSGKLPNDLQVSLGLSEIQFYFHDITKKIFHEKQEGKTFIRSKENKLQN